MIEIFKALSEESRLRILTLLMNREMCVCEIESCLNLSQSNVSRHLTALKRCGVVDSYKKAQWTYYQISEVFQVEHKELWKYLQEQIPKLPTYQSDQGRCEKYKTINICENSKKPH